MGIFTKVIGLDKKIKLLLPKGDDLSTKEIVSLNKKLHNEQQKFPALDVSAHGAPDKYGRVDIIFDYKRRPARTKVDQINELIEEQKAKLKRR